MEEGQFQAKDYRSEQPLRWCPGCGDYALLSCIHKAMAEVGAAPKDVAVISGIGCSSRFPYYTDAYGFHTIHGRGAAVATGVKIANPNLSVWLMTGDGDCLAIGGNHFIHAVRRNVDINIVLFNNKIYGLTKGQYSPTSARGFVTKSSPYGTVEDPFVPAELTLGARGNFFARVIDSDLQRTTATLAAAARHKGASVVEALVNCVIFNNGIHKAIANKATIADATLYLRHGQKMIFGKDNNKGLILDGLKLRAVTIGQDGYTLDDILVHDAHEKDNTLHLLLALMGGGDFPTAIGIIRDVQAPTYEVAVEQQIRDVQARNPVRTLHDFLMKSDVWQIKK